MIIVAAHWCISYMQCFECELMWIFQRGWLLRVFDNQLQASAECFHHGGRRWLPCWQLSLNETYRGSTCPSSPLARWLFILYHRCQKTSMTGFNENRIDLQECCCPAREKTEWSQSFEGVHHSPLVSHHDILLLVALFDSITTLHQFIWLLFHIYSSHDHQRVGDSIFSPQQTTT